MINLLFLLLSVAHADRGSLNGGGLAEMKAISIHMHLKEWMAPCLQNPMACGIQDANSFAITYRAIEMSTPERLVIDPFLATPYLTEKRPGARVMLSSKILYREDGLPKASPEIAALLIEAISSQVSDHPILSLKLEAQRATAGFSEQTVRISFSDQYKFEVSSMSIHHQQKQNHFLYLEDAEKTLNLGDRLPSFGVCNKDESSTQIQNWRVNKENYVTSLAADIATTCGGFTSYQALIVELRLDSRGVIDASSIQLRLYDSL